MKTKTYWYGIKDDESIFNGEEFFVEAVSKEEADRIAHETFGDFHIAYFGRVSEYFAECMGLDTY